MCKRVELPYRLTSEFMQAHESVYQTDVEDFEVYKLGVAKLMHSALDGLRGFGEKRQSTEKIVNDFLTNIESLHDSHMMLEEIYDDVYKALLAKQVFKVLRSFTGWPW